MLCLWPKDEIPACSLVLGTVLWSSQRAWQWTMGTFLSVVPTSATNNSPASVSMVLKPKFVPPLLYTLFLERRIIIQAHVALSLTHRNIPKLNLIILEVIIIIIILDFRLSPCFEYCMYSFGYFILYIQPLKMEPIEGSETSANYNRTPGKYPKEYIQ